jgi:hypothetical protein
MMIPATALALPARFVVTPPHSRAIAPRLRHRGLAAEDRRTLRNSRALQCEHTVSGAYSSPMNFHHAPPMTNHTKR